MFVKVIPSGQAIIEFDFEMRREAIRVLFLIVDGSVMVCLGHGHVAEIHVKYELCGVSDGVETYKKEIFVTIGQYYRLQAVAEPAGAGEVYGAGRYEPRSQARLIAEANPGYRFVKWTYYDQWTGSEYENPALVLDMNQEYLGIVAHFVSEDAAVEPNRKEQTLRLSPNPASDVLMLDWPESFRVEEVQVFSVSGAMMPVSLPEGRVLDVSRLKPGLYMVQLRSGNGEMTNFMKSVVF